MPASAASAASEETRPSASADVDDPRLVARSAGLRYVMDTLPGWRRAREGDQFVYLDSQGHTIADDRHLDRVRKLAIPPAWTDVWICPDPRGHLQATGRDARGRKQYRYHARWREVRDEEKYGRLIAFGEALPRIRQRVEHDLALPGLPRDKLLAAVVRLLETTLIRVGNREYAKDNKHYGLTTLRNRHVKVEGTKLRFRFKGKSGVQHDVGVNDRRLARIIKRCQDLPGQELFQYLDDDGEVRGIESQDVNDYLREITGQDFTAKDFRTWAGTVLAATALREFEAFDSETQAKRNVVRAIEAVAARLGNTPTVCRKCYVHPAVLDAYLSNATALALQQVVNQEISDSLGALRPEEAAVLALLARRLASEAAGSQVERAS